MMSELSKWPSELEAAAILGMSVKSINRYAERGKIEIQKRQRPGKKPENVCNPRDIEKLKPTSHVVPESSSALVPTDETNSLARPATEPAPWVALVPLAAALMQTMSTAITTIKTEAKNTQSLSEKLVLTLKEASRSGFSMAFLRRKVDDGSLKSFRDGRSIKIARATLDEFARRGSEAQ